MIIVFWTDRQLYLSDGGFYVHLFLADWRKEEFQTGESIMVQDRPCSLWVVPGKIQGGELDLPRARGALTELWPKPTETSQKPDDLLSLQ